MSMKVGIIGLKECRARLRAIKSAVDRKITKKAVEAGGKKVLVIAIVNTPMGKKEWGGTGLAKASMGMKVRSYKRAVIAIIGPRTGYKKTTKAKGGRMQTDYGLLKSLLRRDPGKGSNSGKIDPSKYFHFIESGRGVVKAGAKMSLRGVRGAKKKWSTNTGKKVLSDGTHFFGFRTPPIAGRRPLARAWNATRSIASAEVHRVMAEGLSAEMLKV